MANLPESPEWTAGVYQIERNDHRWWWTGWYCE